jgi:hypothetical protein
MMRRVAEKAVWVWERRSQFHRPVGAGLESGFGSGVDKEVEFLVTDLTIPYTGQCCSGGWMWGSGWGSGVAGLG